MNVCVIPDIHGRTFWKKVNIDNFDKVIFLGDYLDPYPQEYISPEESIYNFINILDLKEKNLNKVELLLGNHDLQYLGLSDSSCRTDFYNLSDIFNLYNENKELFNICYKLDNTLFSHAGINQGWLEQNDLILLESEVDSFLNNEFKKLSWEKPVFGLSGIKNYTDSIFGDIGRSRGGYAPYGSIVWADADETFNKPAFPNLIQIIGHSQLRQTSSFIQKNGIILCDSRDAFSWDGKDLKVVDNVTNI